MFRSFIVVLFISVFLFTGCSTEVDYLPKSIFELSMTRKLTDSEAESFVNRLHFGEVAAERNEIAFYSSPKGEAIIYVSYYDAPSEAEKDLVLMAEKISPQNSVFTGGESFEVNGVRVYRYLGMGQTHFTFAHENALIWLSGEIGWAEKFLEIYLNHID